MISGIAVDCCWLVELESDATPLSEILHILHYLQSKRIPLLLDHEDHIRQEYRRHVTTGVGKKFFQSRILAGPVFYYSGKFTRATDAALDKIPFDPSDRPYLAVAASHGDSPFLTGEEKHLQPRQVEAVQRACGVHVVGTESVGSHLT